MLVTAINNNSLSFLGQSEYIYFIIERFIKNNKGTNEEIKDESITHLINECEYILSC